MKFVATYQPLTHQTILRAYKSIWCLNSKIYVRRENEIIEQLRQESNSTKNIFHSVVQNILLHWRWNMAIRLYLTVHVRGSVGKFRDSYCCNCLGERKWEWRPRSHFRKPIGSVCHVTQPSEQASLFRLRASFCPAMDGKIEHRVCIKFCVKLCKSATKILEMLSWGFQRTFFKPDSGFWKAFTFQGLSSVS
jgi:hypothetical protein